MRIDIRKATPWACLLALALQASFAKAASDDFFHTIPRSVDAIDVNTGGPYMAPPIPYGHYAKSPSDVIGKHLGCLTCGLGGLHNKLCGLCNGKGCSDCCGTGFKDGCGHGHDGGSGHGGLGHGGFGNGGGLFHHGNGGSGCGACGGAGCGLCMGNGSGLKGLFNKPFGHKGLCAAAMASPQSMAVAPGKTHPIRVHATSQAPGIATTYPVASSQVVVTASHQNACSSCHGKGCGLCGNGFGKGLGGGGLLSKLCHGCGGKGCGMCGGAGMVQGEACDHCGGKGCGHCGHTGFLKKLCSFCGGKGCKFCGGGHGALLSKLAHPFGHGNKIKYFVGAGGPVPLTPGYVPYVVTTRSPRDYFAFPPFSDIDP